MNKRTKERESKSQKKKEINWLSSQEQVDNLSAGSSKPGTTCIMYVLQKKYIFYQNKNNFCYHLIYEIAYHN